MIHGTISACIACLSWGTGPAPGHVRDMVRLDRPGMTITTNVRVAPGTYELAAGDTQAAVEITGDDITVDLTGVTLVGAGPGTPANAYTGRGITITGRNVTVKGVTVRGYKVGVYAEKAPGLSIADCDVSRNFRQRLKSTVQREDLSDWLYGHENDRNEWLRYGAGIYLYRCPDARITKCRARNGQNGLCMVRCDRARITDNDMSFMSGWGLAMWRSSDGEIINNKFDWCMRGYSHGVYSRGQDSTGILVYEQCHRNLFAYNSATHGGDGFFLYAGNETVKKTGRGGCNDNIVYCNDFSHAAANGIEATFSHGNVFVANILDECTHGVWAGYSFDTVIQGNRISRCKYGVSIEHGHGNVITGNVIADTELGVQLWWDDDKDLLTTPFGKVHDRCPSKSNTVTNNRFQRVRKGIRLADDTGSAVRGNEFEDVEVPVHLAGDTSGTQLALDDGLQNAVVDESTNGVSFQSEGSKTSRGQDRYDMAAIEQRLGSKHRPSAFLPDGVRRGRNQIFIDQWGPYDFTDVRAFPSKITGGNNAVVQLLGPESDFRVTKVQGEVRVTPTEGQLPAKVEIDTTEAGLQPFGITIATDAGPLALTGTLLSTQWTVTYYGWDASTDPRSGDAAWHGITTEEPLSRAETSELDFVWHGGSPNESVPRDHFATVATTQIELPAGKWDLRTISDDGVRVFINGKEVLSNWTWHGPTEDKATIELAAGSHRFRVEHFEIDGHAELRFKLEPARP